MRERKHDDYLKKRCDELNWLCEKFVSPSGVSKPDWIITTTEGDIIFWEDKATDEEPSPAQRRDHQRRLDRGANVVWTNSILAMESVIQMVLQRGAKALKYVR